ncbi:MAG TPA: hypothetical protein VMV94_12865 [Phycisphaerae bacterium]|nr:hypothetical protein [Phycisphaerae bacterium]
MEALLSSRWINLAKASGMLKAGEGRTLVHANLVLIPRTPERACLSADNKPIKKAQSVDATGHAVR